MEVLQLGMWRDSAGFPFLGGIKMGNRAPGNSGNLLHHQEGIGSSPPGNMGGSSWMSIHGCHKCGNRGLGSPWRSSPSIPVPAAPGRSCQDLTESRKSSGTLEFDCASELREHKSHSQQFYGKPPSLWEGPLLQNYFIREFQESGATAEFSFPVPSFPQPPEKQDLPLGEFCSKLVEN